MTKAALMFSVVLLALTLAIPAPARAQDNYPSSPIRIVYGFAAGGGGDLVARVLAQKLSTQMNANVFVENRPGANQNIGAAFVAKSAPDGHTLLLNTSSLLLSPAMGEKLDYDVFRDMTPIALVSSAPLVLFVSPSTAANSLPDFIAHIKANPGKVTYGSSGTGGILIWDPFFSCKPMAWMLFTRFMFLIRAPRM
jgi:tripartite-type tricarboxylate transporter receptor subunit TctC